MTKHDFNEALDKMNSSFKKSYPFAVIVYKGYIYNNTVYLPNTSAVREYATQLYEDLGFGTITSDKFGYPTLWHHGGYTVYLATTGTEKINSIPFPSPYAVTWYDMDMPAENHLIHVYVCGRQHEPAGGVSTRVTLPVIFNGEFYREARGQLPPTDKKYRFIDRRTRTIYDSDDELDICEDVAKFYQVSPEFEHMDTTVYFVDAKTNKILHCSTN
jgi:hypothetical protein